MEQAIIQEITEDMLHTYPLFMHLQMVDTNLMCISLLLNKYFLYPFHSSMTRQVHLGLA